MILGSAMVQIEMLDPQGPYPTAPDVLVRQFARVEILDDGGDITVKFTGYDSTHTARVAMSFSTSDVEPPKAIPGGAVVSVQHLMARSTHPRLTWVPSNWAPAHLSCNKSAGATGRTAEGSMGVPTQEW